MVAQVAGEGGNLDEKESIMCYEFSDWSRKLRAAELARKPQQKPEQVTKQPEPAPQAQPAAPETRVKERETAPA